MEALTTPEIFVFSLHSASQQSLFRNVHSRLLDALAVKSNLRQATNVREALGRFDQNDCPKGALVTGPGIVASRNVAVSQKLANYVRIGGKLVLGGSFSAEIRPNDLGRYIREKWDLP